MRIPVSPRLTATLLAAAAAIGASVTHAQRAATTKRQPAAPADEADWVRVQRDASGQPNSFQTAIGRYQGEVDGQQVTVDLVGAVHVGDRSYYEGLNGRFRKYDALLYELVAPEGTVVPRGGRAKSDSPIGAAQNGMKSLLDLDHQLEVVDYTRPNFVHADMSPEQFFKTMEDRDEGLLKLYFRMLGQGIAEQTRAAQQGHSAEMDLMMAFFARDRSRRMKIALAGQLVQMDGLLSNFGGEKGTTIIEERNRTAMDVLAREIDRGKKKIGVFYGAGHLVDMHERLEKRFGLRQVSKDWITAWNLSD